MPLKAFAAALLLSAVSSAASAHRFNDADKADLDRVSAALNAIRTMKGGFLQIGPDGQIDEGEFTLMKPGRIRFQYDPPTPTLIVSNGKTVAVENTKLKTVDRYALSDTPLDIILADKIDLKSNSDIVGVDHQGDQLVIRAHSGNFGVHADVTMTFAEPALELKQWTVVDNQGLSTTVALKQTQTGVDIPADQFVVPDGNPFAHSKAE